jgi:hypothetical protein
MEYRRNLLLSRIGPDVSKVRVDHFLPEKVETQNYDNLKQILHRYYAKKYLHDDRTRLFLHRHRKAGETVIQFIGRQL